MLPLLGDDGPATLEGSEYKAYSLREIADDIGGVEPSEQLCITTEHECFRTLEQSDGVGTHANELSGVSGRLELDRRDGIAARVVVGQSLRHGISRCDATVRQPQCADDENSSGRVAAGEIYKNSRCNGPKI